MLKRILKKYPNFIFAVFILVTAYRIIEASLIFYNFNFDLQILKAELFGWLADISAAGALLLFYFPIYYLLYKYNKGIAKFLNLAIVLIFFTIGFFAIRYFIYQLNPLDIFLYQYSLKEVLFTINTSNISLFLNIFLLFCLLGIIIYFFWKINERSFSAGAIKLMLSIPLLSFALYFLSQSIHKKKMSVYSKNKTTYFIHQSFNYFLKDENTMNMKYSLENFRNLYPEKTFINKKYPLLHQANRFDSLGSYFQSFNSPPNLVILIVEGLNDDYIHKFKGVELMPFLQKLKTKSLYWNHCFTLGERSFAVVPSLLGGLPYGKTGFTLLENLPRHLSLVSTLKSNNYFTTFFYGQGAWFHKKNRFFKYNNIDLVFDKDKFNRKYKKIFAGDDDFFWGYNDKDLFKQSIEVIDSLKQKPRLDIYFTGTTHPPYKIENEDYYSKKLAALKNPSNASFMDNYSTFLKSILFADDALQEFFKKYKKRKDFDNSIFIITGDHPITEIPVKNSLKRYHVPFLIYSPKLKTAKTFSNFVSHLDFTETILPFLQKYIPNVPTVSHSLGQQLLPKDKTAKNIAFMNDNREIIDFYSDGFYLSDNQLYEVDDQLNIKKSQNQKKKVALKERLNIFKQFSYASSTSNAIISDSLYCHALNHEILFSLPQSDTIDINSEYYSLIERLEVPNNTIYFDLSLEIESKIDETMSIVYVIKNENDSSILWQNRGFEPDKQQTDYHIKIKNLPTKDTTLYFNAFIWNQNKLPIRLSNINLLLHTSNSTSHKQIEPNKKIN